MRKVAVVLGFCLAVSVPACESGDSVSGPSPDRVRAVVLPYLTNAAFHIAREEGYFAKRNLQVEFVRLTRQQAVMTAMARGEVDVEAGMVSASRLNLVTGGARIRFVAALGQLTPGACPYNAIVVRRELLESGALQDPARVRSLRIDADILMPQGYWLDELVRPLNLTVEDLDITDIPSVAAIEALRSGSLDVTIVSEPYLGIIAKSEEAAIWKTTGELLPGYLLSVMSYSSSLLDERPEVGERFAAAMLEAIRQFRLGKTSRNVELVASFTGLSPEQATAMCWPSGPDDGRVDLSSINGFQEWLVSHGFLDRVLTDDDLVDHRFIDRANVELAR